MTPAGEPYGATPLTAEERDGLIPSNVTLRSELDEVEDQNILKAVVWAFDRRRNPVSETFARGLHKRMLDDVWRWAGQYRTSNKSIGVDKTQITARLYQAFDNFTYWIENKTYPPDEIAVRFHHELVLIHPFPNGNGRWSRLMADLLIVYLDGDRFTWGRSRLTADDEVRRAYIDALRAADNHDFMPLLKFARS